MSKQGFVKSYRRIFDHPLLAKDHAARHLFSDLMHFVAWDATTQDWRGAPVTVKRGQVMISTRKLAEVTGFTHQIVRSCLAKLANHQIVKINTLPNQGPMVVTICNWDKYQMSQHTANTPANTTLTHLQHTKEERKEKEEYINPLTPLQGEQVGQDQDLPLPLEAKEPEPASAAPAEPKRKRQRPPSGPKSYPIEFEAVWQNYPRAGRNEKKSAFDAWNALSDADKAALPSWIKRLEAKLAGAGFDRRPKDMHRWLAKSLDDYRDADAAEAGQTVDPYAHLRSANEMQWRIRIKTHANGSWPATELGPPPCSKSCLVPRHIIEELGLSDAYSPAGLATNTHDPRHPIHWHKSEAAA